MSLGLMPAAAVSTSCNLNQHAPRYSATLSDCMRPEMLDPITVVGACVGACVGASDGASVEAATIAATPVGAELSSESSIGVQTLYIAWLVLVGQLWSN